MTKEELINRITDMNRSARAEFLAEFTEAELQRYLENLESVWAGFKAQFVAPNNDFWPELDNVREVEEVVSVG